MNAKITKIVFQVFSLTPTIGQKPITILAVADGMGGHAYGEHVSEQVLRKLSLSLFEQLIIESSLNNNVINETSVSSEYIAQILLKAVEQANAHIRRMIEANKWGKAGSTVVVAVILDDKAIAINVGDSPLFHYQQKSGNLTKVTQEHTVANALVNARIITEEMARHHEGRNRLEFYIGCPELHAKVPLSQVSLESGDLLLLCTDGVSSLLRLQEIRLILSNSNQLLEEIAQSLIKAAQIAGETDNQTLILWKVN
ncbi:MAG: serine/threonine-protein phosphatase [Methylacidiphilales bacterium]|nr:serine/threonine-protein phosphatase [Candidatus Methylacidiphilales bacterium]